MQFLLLLLLSPAMVFSYSFDGTGNNLVHPDWGSAGSALIQRYGTHYPGDGSGSNATYAGRPSCCALEPFFTGLFDTADMHGLNQAHVIFGQFVWSHDTALSNGNDSEPVSSADETCLADHVRKQVVVPQEDSGPRRHPNAVTSFVDMHNVYGESEAKSNALREFSRGRLLTSGLNMLPMRCADRGIEIATAGKDANQLFCAGDVRVNENIYLTSFHTLFMREHNRLAALLAAQNPGWSDQQLFDKARVLNIARYQQILFYEWLPLMVGRDYFQSSGLAVYPGYNSNLNPGFFAESSQAVFRGGHPRIANRVLFEDPPGQVVAEKLITTAFEPARLEARGLEAWFRGMAQVPAQPFGPFLPPDLNEVPGPLPDLHLFAVDCLRSRDFGLIDYASLRDELGIPIAFAADVTNNSYNQFLLGKYPHLSDIDLFVGMILEDHASGAPVGPTVQRIMALQAEHTRNGDRFWFENPQYAALSFEEKLQAKGVSMAKVVLANTALTCVAESFFEMSWRSDAFCKAPGGYITRPSNQWMEATP